MTPAQHFAPLLEDFSNSLFREFKAGLNDGTIRAAEPDPNTPSGWRVNAWVKECILAGFRFGKVVNMTKEDGAFFFDKQTYPRQLLKLTDGIRIVPGGSSIRDGAHVGRGVTCMPPMFVNVGAYVDEGTMIDSHALVGSCAQIGKRVHLSAAAQIGGVLEPVGALPVIVEDEALIGGNCGVYEGTVVKARAVLGAGVILTRSTPVYDLVRNQIHRATDDQPLVIPADAVVVAGSRAITTDQGRAWGLSLYTPIIVNNAGYTWDNVIQKTTDEQFQAMVDIHLVAPFRLLRAASGWLRETAKKEMAEGRRVMRKVVNITSIAATDGGPGQSGYASGKAGVVGLTRVLAKEWGRYNINVNCVGFGLIETRLIQPLTADSKLEVKGREIPVGVQQRVIDTMTTMSPLGRKGTVDEAAGPVLFFCSPLADYITGEVLIVSGGMHF